MGRRTVILGLAAVLGCANQDSVKGGGDDDDDPIDTGDSDSDVDADTDADTDADDPEPSCENPPTEPVIDPEMFTACCEGAHCVPVALVPEESRENLGACDDGAGYCVPDLFIETQGFFVPASCESLAGAEGRCLSTCLPQIAEQLDRLPQSTCPATERCAPCCDPMTGEESGACSQGCDVGPAGECAPAFPTCCEDDSGHCIPRDLIPDEDEESLEDCGGGMACVPDVMQEEGFEGEDCVGSGMMGEYDGVCLPDCLEIDMEWSMDTATCAAGYVCVPCQDPFGADTGAPGCEPGGGGDGGGFGGF